MSEHQDYEDNLTPPDIDPVVCSAIEEVLGYLWEKEGEDYKEWVKENEGRHIFESMVTVDQWLFGHKKTVEQFMEEWDV